MKLKKPISAKVNDINGLVVNISKTKNSMEIVKKIAKWVLKKELEELEGKNFKLMNDNSRLSKMLYGKRKVILSPLLLKTIIEMLPDPNRVGMGYLTSDDLKLRTINVKESFDGQEYVHTLKFVKTIGAENESDIKGLVVNISNYDMNVFIPLRRENVSYEVFGVQIKIDTYFWDFYMAGIRMLSKEAWELSASFIRAQTNVMKEFRESGLL